MHHAVSHICLAQPIGANIAQFARVTVGNDYAARPGDLFSKTLHTGIRHNALDLNKELLL